MNEEQFEILIGWHRDTQKRLGQLQFMVALVFIAVVGPIVLGWFGIKPWWL